jgi:tryptophan synthase beta subunit
MGEVDIAKQHPNVLRMKILGANVIPVTHGQKTLKEAVDAAFEAYLKDPETTMYCIGSVVGPHPFPMMVRDFQKIIGIETREQFIEMTGELPDAVTACVGGGSNAMGMFCGFLEDDDVKLYGVEPLGRGSAPGDHAASVAYGKPGYLHGFYSYTLQDDNGEPMRVYSCASGLDYQSVGPEHAMLHDKGRVEYVPVDDNDTLKAFFELSRLEGIIPAIESAHAVAYAIAYAKAHPHGSIIACLSGRGDKDIDYIYERYGLGEGLL